MLPIKKSAATPAALRGPQGDPNRSYADLGEQEGQALREQLCADQGYLCAYCMSRIDTNAATGEQRLGEVEHPRRLRGCSVEHLTAQSEDASADLLWRNMVAVCSGRRVWGEGLHCDKARGDAPIHQLDPLQPQVAARLTWRRERKQLHAHPADALSPAERAQVAQDIETLRLNIAWLARNRFEVLETLCDAASSAAGDQRVPTAWLAQRRRWLTTPDEAGRLPEYAGVLLWQLERWERRGR